MKGLGTAAKDSGILAMPPPNCAHFHVRMTRRTGGKCHNCSRSRSTHMHTDAHNDTVVQKQLTKHISTRECCFKKGLPVTYLTSMRGDRSALPTIACVCVCVCTCVYMYI